MAQIISSVQHYDMAKRYQLTDKCIAQSNWRNKFNFYHYFCTSQALCNNVISDVNSFALYFSQFLYMIGRKLLYVVCSALYCNLYYVYNSAYLLSSYLEILYTYLALTLIEFEPYFTTPRTVYDLVTLLRVSFFLCAAMPTQLQVSQFA